MRNQIVNLVTKMLQIFQFSSPRWQTDAIFKSALMSTTLQQIVCCMQNFVWNAEVDHNDCRTVGIQNWEIQNCNQPPSWKEL